MEKNLDLSTLTQEERLFYYRTLYDELYATSVAGTVYIWRALTQREYKHIKEFSENEEQAFERVCQTAIIEPAWDYQNGCLAYLPEILGKQIMEYSGFTKSGNIFEMFDRYRAEMMNFEKQAEVIINRAFSYITFEMMAGWTKTKLLEYLAKAEWSLQHIDRIEHIQLVRQDEAGNELEDGEEVEEKDPKETIREIAQRIRERGGDPMLQLKGVYETPKKNYVEYPFIGGSNHYNGIIQGLDWEGGVVSDAGFNTIREQVQELSDRRR